MKNKNDFQEFISGNNTSINPQTENLILEVIHNKLNPQFKNVFLKTMLIHIAASVAIISICPQLGVGFTDHTVLTHFFMQFGEVFCTLACASLYISTSFILTGVILTKEEYKKLNDHAFISSISISLASLLFIVILGTNETIIHLILWPIAAIFIGLLTIKVLNILKFYKRHFSI